MIRIRRLGWRLGLPLGIVVGVGVGVWNGMLDAHDLRTLSISLGVVGAYAYTCTIVHDFREHHRKRLK